MLVTFYILTFFLLKVLINSEVTDNDYISKIIEDMHLDFASNFETLQQTLREIQQFIELKMSEMYALTSKKVIKCHSHEIARSISDMELYKRKSLDLITIHLTTLAETKASQPKCFFDEECLFKLAASMTTINNNLNQEISLLMEKSWNLRNTLERNIDSCNTREAVFTTEIDPTTSESAFSSVEKSDISTVNDKEDSQMSTTEDEETTEDKMSTTEDEETTEDKMSTTEDEETTEAKISTTEYEITTEGRVSTTKDAITTKKAKESHIPVLPVLGLFFLLATAAG